MYAVININDKQYVVRNEEVLKVNRVKFADGESFDVNKVIAVSDGKELKLGTPYVEGVSVTLKVIENKRDKKIIVFKKKKRKRYEVRNGHKQPISVLKVEAINL